MKKEMKKGALEKEKYALGMSETSETRGLPLK